MDSEPTILGYYRIVKNNRKLLIYFVGIPVIITMIGSLLSHKIYESTASILPPEDTMNSGNTSALSRLSSEYSSLLPGLAETSSPSDIINAMLKSDRMAQDIINNFNLKERYKQKYRIYMKRKLAKNTDISISKENVISITVLDTDPQIAADIANFYVSNLDKMNAELELSSSNPIVRILDVAYPAERKTKPRIKLNMFLAAFFSTTIFICYIFSKEYLKKLREP